MCKSPIESHRTILIQMPREGPLLANDLTQHLTWNTFLQEQPHICPCRFRRMLKFQHTGMLPKKRSHQLLLSFTSPHITRFYTLYPIGNMQPISANTMFRPAKPTVQAPDQTRCQSLSHFLISSTEGILPAALTSPSTTGAGLDGSIIPR